MEYDEINGEIVPKRIHTVLISTQHSKDVTNKKLIIPTIPKKLLDDNTKFIVNPLGSFIIGGSINNKYNKYNKYKIKYYNLKKIINSSN